jgi:hypothetical protein
MFGGMREAREGAEIPIGFCSGNLKERGHLKNLCLDGIILKWISQK